MDRGDRQGRDQCPFQPDHAAHYFGFLVVDESDDSHRDGEMFAGLRHTRPDVHLTECQYHYGQHYMSVIYHVAHQFFSCAPGRDEQVEHHRESNQPITDVAGQGQPPGTARRPGWVAFRPTLGFARTVPALSSITAASAPAITGRNPPPHIDVPSTITPNVAALLVSSGWRFITEAGG